MMDRTERYIDGLSSIIDIEKGDGFVIIKSSCGFTKYKYKSFDDLKSFVTTYYYDNIWNGMPMRIKDLELVSGLTQQGLHKMFARNYIRIKRYL